MIEDYYSSQILLKAAPKTRAIKTMGVRYDYNRDSTLFVRLRTVWNQEQILPLQQVVHSGFS